MKPTPIPDAKPATTAIISCQPEIDLPAAVSTGSSPTKKIAKNIVANNTIPVAI